MNNTKKSKKKKVMKFLFIVSAICILIAIVFTVCINAYIKTSVKDRIISPKEASKLKADCILVLGAGVMGDGKPSAMLKDRLLQGVELYNNNSSEKLLMSGDHAQKDYDEVNTMKKFAIDKGVPSEDVFMDHAGLSTYESVYRAKEIFKTKKIIIVTQKYHLYRALYIADKLGIEAFGVASDPRKYSGQQIRDMREAVARVKDFLFTIFRPQPTYLGETIPVSGNGDITNDKT